MLDDDILNDLNDLEDDAIGEESEESGSGSGAEGAVVRRSELLSSAAFREHVETIKRLVDARIGGEGGEAGEAQEVLIERSNSYAAAIGKEVAGLFRAVKAVYGRKFPELESIVTQPALYCKAVREVEGGGAAFAYLSNHQRISLQIALSSVHEQLAAEELARVLEQVGAVVRLHEDCNLLLMFLESCMQAVAPNLCQLLGSLVASRLVSLAGGVRELAAIPACNIQVMGGQRAGQVGLNIGDRNHTGVFGQMDIVRDAPQQFRMNLVRMLASNAAKCARADLLKSQGGLGSRLREEVNERFEKIQEEGGLHRIDLPLPAPDQQPKKRRGGKRYRKSKELLEMSEMRRQQNRLKFGEEAEEEVEAGVGLGMLSQGTGKLRVGVKKAKLRLSKATESRANKKSGLESSLNLSAAQGIELLNPAQQRPQHPPGKQSIFGKDSGFQTVLNSKFGAYK